MAVVLYNTPLFLILIDYNVMLEVIMEIIKTAVIWLRDTEI